MLRVLATGMEWFTERPGGLPRYFSDYLQGLVRSGVDSKALVGIKNVASLETLPAYVRGVSLSKRGPVAVRSAWQRAVTDELLSRPYDVWNSHFAYYAWGALNARRLGGIPIVSHFHGPWAYEARVENMRLSGALRFQMQKAIERRVYKSSDRFIVLSHAFKDVLTRDYSIPSDRVYVVHGAVDTSRFYPTKDKERVRMELSIPSEKNVLVSVRRLANRMGLDRLIIAMQTLISEFPNLLLIIVGTGVLEQELKSLVTVLGLDGYVRFAGRVPDSDLPKYYQAANISVVPSVAWEGFGLVTAESLACGTPVVATPVGGSPEVINGLNSNLLLSGSAVSDLVQGLSRVLGNLKTLPTTEECRGYVLRHFTWDVIIPQIKDIFAASMAGSGSSRQVTGKSKPSRTTNEEGVSI